MPICILFIIQYCILVIKLLFDKNPKFVKYMRKYNFNLLLLILVVITNFWPWYLLWGMTTIMWQKGKTINNYIYIMFAVETALVTYFVFGSSWENDIIYDIIKILLFLMCKLIEKFKEDKKKEKLKEIKA